MVQINGESYNVSGKSLDAVLADLNFDAKKIAVEINEDIVPKANYPQVLLKDGDTVEVVSFVGGG
ncbi:MAG: sulfur carrier protein ThiS [Pseudobutyrivibrio sp.]|nr:sulfur carrier protein ThiS [Pseudobutyrivibrio sp.]